MLIHNFYCFLLNEIVHIYYIEGIKSCSEDTTTTTTLLQFVLFTGFGLASSRNYQSLYPSTPILNYHSYLPLYESNQYFVALINCIKSNYIYIYIYIYIYDKSKFMVLQNIFYTNSNRLHLEKSPTLMELIKRKSPSPRDSTTF